MAAQEHLAAILEDAAARGDFDYFAGQLIASGTIKMNSVPNFRIPERKMIRRLDVNGGTITIAVHDGALHLHGVADLNPQTHNDRLTITPESANDVVVSLERQV